MKSETCACKKVTWKTDSKKAKKSDSKKAKKSGDAFDKKIKKKMKKAMALTSDQALDQLVSQWPMYDRPFYFHFRDEKYKDVTDGVTLCMQPKHNNRFNVGVACCSKIDNFSKKIGRNIALGRVNASGIEVVATNPGELKNKALAVLKTILDNKRQGKKIINSNKLEGNELVNIMFDLFSKNPINKNIKCPNSVWRKINS